MAIIGMFFQDGLTGSAWGDWANYTASPRGAGLDHASLPYGQMGPAAKRQGCRCPHLASTDQSSWLVLWTIFMLFLHLHSVMSSCCKLYVCISNVVHHIQAIIHSVFSFRWLFRLGPFWGALWCLGLWLLGLPLPSCLAFFLSGAVDCWLFRIAVVLSAVPASLAPVVIAILDLRILRISLRSVPSRMLSLLTPASIWIPSVTVLPCACGAHAAVPVHHHRCLCAPSLVLPFHVQFIHP